MPLSVDIGYGRLTLEHIRQESGSLVVKLSLSESAGRYLGRGTTLDFGDTYYFCSADAESTADFRSVYPSGTGILALERYLHVPSGAETVTITQEVVIRRTSSDAVFRFERVRPVDLPLTRSVGSAVVTLCRAGSETLKKPSGMTYSSWTVGALSEGQPCFLLYVRSRLPEGFIRSEEGRSVTGYVLIDDNGRTHEAQRYYADNDSIVRENPTFSPPGTAPRNPAPGKLIVVNDYLAFKPITPPPTRFTFQIKGRFPADPKDVVRITFRDVPLP